VKFAPREKGGATIFAALKRRRRRKAKVRNGLKTRETAEIGEKSGKEKKTVDVLRR
jgi:hypothetical protein